MKEKAKKAVKPQQQPTAEQQLSTTRRQKLSTAVFDAIGKTADEVEGDFTAFELTEVFARIIIHYSRMGLQAEHGNGIEATKEFQGK